MLMGQKHAPEEQMISALEAMEKNQKLFREKNFLLRLQAIDHIEFHIIDRINGIEESAGCPGQMSFLKQYARKVKDDLEFVNATLFHRLRRRLSQEKYKDKFLSGLINEYLGYNFNLPLQPDEDGYDNLDLFLNGLLTDQNLPAETKKREPEMVFYQKTPARVILALIKQADCKPQDVFFDLGSGLGQAAILVNLISSVVSKGVEFQPAFCDYAKACVTDLNLKGVDFINMDARYADYSTGTIFFLYSPFKGKMLEEVLHKLHGEAKQREIKIFTYGPCTPEVARQSWLLKADKMSNYAGGYGSFLSR